MLRLEWVADGEEAIQRHDDQGEDTRDHTGVLNQVDELAHELSERPVAGRIDDGVERHAEDEEEHVGDSEVQDEQTSRVALVIAVLQDDDQHQAVTDAA